MKKFYINPILTIYKYEVNETVATQAGLLSQGENIVTDYWGEIPV